jgi:hypothetical protein
LKKSRLNSLLGGGWRLAVEFASQLEHWRQQNEQVFMCNASGHLQPTIDIPRFDEFERRYLGLNSRKNKRQLAIVAKAPRGSSLLFLAASPNQVDGNGRCLPCCGYERTHRIHFGSSNSITDAESFSSPGSTATHVTDSATNFPSCGWDWTFSVFSES